MLGHEGPPGMEGRVQDSKQLAAEGASSSGRPMRAELTDPIHPAAMSTASLHLAVQQATACHSSRSDRGASDGPIPSPRSSGVSARCRVPSCGDGLRFGRAGRLWSASIGMKSWLPAAANGRSWAATRPPWSLAGAGTLNAPVSGPGRRASHAALSLQLWRQDRGTSLAILGEERAGSDRSLGSHNGLCRPVMANPLCLGLVSSAQSRSSEGQGVFSLSPTRSHSVRSSGRFLH